MKGADTSAYQSNVAVLQANEAWFNNDGGSCSFGETEAECYSSTFEYVQVDAGGSVLVANKEEGYGCRVDTGFSVTDVSCFSSD